ncbi:MAG: outer membrane protein assembly factor BamA [Ghiorsea sp.]|nr:outer membrane protein assembly factor BamA [Ghiorsea sp.]
MIKFGFKTLVCSVLLLSFMRVAAAEDIVVEVAIEGNRYVETPAVIAKVHSKAGLALDRRVISQDIRRLFATGYFSDVYTEGERVEGGIKLIYVVKENPVIASVSFEGNEELSNKKLRPKMKIKPSLILSPLVERIDTNMIRKAYLAKGYYQVDVNIEAIPLDDGRVDVKVRIDEGTVTHIKDIRFIGNQAFSSDELRNVLASSVSSLGSWFSNNDVFNRQRFEADAQMIRVFYQDAGYLDAKVESTRLMLTPNKDSFYLSLSIYEGAAFTVSAIQLTGDITPSKEALMKTVKLEEGELYSLEKLRQTIQAMTEKVGDEGYAFANVTPMFHRNLKNNTVVIEFDIEKGREVYVERVEVHGHSKTQEHVIRRELRQSEGERYSASKIRRSKERLQRISYLSKSKISTPRGKAANTVDMKLDIEEGKSGSFSAGINYSQLYGAGFVGSVSENNFLGGGYKTSLSTDIGGAVNNYDISLTDPYFFGEDVSASLRVFQSQTDIRTIVLYNQDSKGASFNLGMALNEYMRYSVGYNLTTTTLSGVPTTSSLALRSQEGTYSTGEFVQSLSYDTRDRRIAPSEGGLYSASLGYAGATGDRKFYETTVSAQQYFPLTDFWTLRTALKLGQIQGYNGEEVPIYRRYSLGGVGSMRGYNYYGISVVDPQTLDILGGTKKATASIDLQFPLPYMEQAGFRGAFFVDAGTVWGTSDVTFDKGAIRGSYGFGIEWASPVGPIALTWATAINAQPLDDVRRFEFALGRGF